MDVLQNMMLFSELVQCGGNVYTWCYDAKGKLLRSNCPDEAFLASAFELFGCKQRMLEHGNRDDVPVTLGTALGLLWGAAFEKEEEKLKRVWVIGPVFYQDVTLRGIEDGLKYYSKLEISVAWTIQLYKALEKVPTLQNTIIHPFVIDAIPYIDVIWITSANAISIASSSAKNTITFTHFFTLIFSP